ncbi:30S ribosomal protein S5 [Candidatus Shikimatogenerans bostrichidophilus]|uniref:30S ribosomal protein S5 n=1 Tax=Candidatus Shikimatogenerans bostrichidophilus TaxID=2943807 RepID=UPI00296617CD
MIKIKDIKEKIVKIKRVCKVTKGRRDFSFTCIIVKGNYNGIVGYGMGKAKEIPNSIYKAEVKANKNLIKIPIVNETIPHEQSYKYCSSKILLYPAYKGTGVIAGGSARIVLELAGIKNVYAKFIGSSNVYNCVKATYNALKEIKENYYLKLKINENIKKQKK